MMAPEHDKNGAAMGNKFQYSTEEALGALMAGKEDALDHYFRLHFDSLTWFAFKLLGDKPTAEDVAAEAFVKLWKHRFQLSGTGSIKAWLFMSVKNSCMDQLRKLKRIRVHQSGLKSAEVSEDSILQSMIEAETFRQILDCVDLLPPRIREVFQLFYFQGMSYEQIASLLHTSPNTVRNQRARAIEILREKKELFIDF
jgi:RNA polymerase sigma-70 factor (family 1)